MARLGFPYERWETGAEDLGKDYVPYQGQWGGEWIGALEAPT